VTTSTIYQVQNFPGLKLKSESNRKSSSVAHWYMYIYLFWNYMV